MEVKENSRRKFLVKAGKTSVLLAGGAIVLSGCNNEPKASPELTRGKSKKTEILYQKSPHWEEYFSVAY
ncbi:Uncharacterised protein [Wolinella succinogenes]|uniref:hypothetical protein n=1 Tax=Wolinella succinogenes TaxID=844 RepID=UPI000F6D7B94|nr:hypothetical protein [Wolinella succinogenes]NLU33679.1 hypothetical protein [Wolinella succinogenes]VEG81415.1 Uncharacterised protein [Wolinella succinogenes]